MGGRENEFPKGAFFLVILLYMFSNLNNTTQTVVKVGVKQQTQPQYE